jgi:phosphoribosylaminoimidazole-succinocarboxamide synthase
MSQYFVSSIPGQIPLSQGKTRDMFPAKAKHGPHVGKELLLIVATDRLSTHNIVHVSTIPMKGEVLTALTVFWFTKLFQVAGIRHHLIASGEAIYDYLDMGSKEVYGLHKRGIVVEKYPVVPIEFIYRDRLCGSLYSKYYAVGRINPYGIVLPPGLPLMAPFHEPLFTPTDKSESDDPLLSSKVLERYPDHCALSKKSFVVTRDHLRNKGYEQIDGKFEVGTDASGCPVMVDEVSTPDSSRFCLKDSIRFGEEPPYLDKQIARDEAMRIWDDDAKKPLVFNPSLVRQLSATYNEIFGVITGFDLWDFQRSELDWVSP